MKVRGDWGRSNEKAFIFLRLRRSFERVFAASPLSLAPDETAMLRKLLQYNIIPVWEIY